MKVMHWTSGFEIDGKREATLEDVQSCVGKGWHDILARLVKDLFDLGWDGEVSQVKEKFGGLRFYTGAMSDECYKRVSQAEEEADKTCEVCGERGQSRGRGWIKTLCDEHDK